MRFLGSKSGLKRKISGQLAVLLVLNGFLFSLVPIPAMIPSVQAASTYQTSSTTYNWHSFDGGATDITSQMGDEVMSSPITLPFTLSFFGNDYTQVIVGDNGYITFDTDSSAYSPDLLPNASSPNNIIAGFWMDLDTGAGGAVKHELFGSSPSRAFVVQYDSVPFYGGSPAGTCTMQIKLFESSNNVEIHTSACDSDGYDVTQGLENASGTAAVTVAGRNNTPFALTNDGVRFTYAPSIAYTQNAYRWRNDDGSDSAATWAAAENAQLSGFDRGTSKRLRLGVANSGAEKELLRKAAAALEYTPYGSVYSAAIDTVNGYAYLGVQNSTTFQFAVVKMSLGSGASAPTMVGSVALNFGESQPYGAAIDIANGYAYFSTYTSPSRVVKIALGAGFDPPTRIGAVTLDSGENNPWAFLIDAANGYGYLGTDTSPGRVVKVSLGSGSNPPTRVGAVTLNAGENYLNAAVIDAANGYAYFGTTYTFYGIVIKVALGAGAALPTRIGALSLNSGETSIRSAVIDPANGYAYIGTNTSPSRVVKVALGAGAALPTRIGAVTLNAGENIIYSGAIDAANGYAYFGTLTTPGRLVKISLGSGSDPPTRIAAGTTIDSESFLGSAVADAANGYAYFGTVTSPGRVIKVSLGVGDAAPTKVGSLTLNSGENNLTSVVIDAANGYAYFGTDTSPGQVVKVALGAGAAAPTRTAALALNAGENGLRSAVAAAANGYAYFGTDTSPGQVVKVALGAGAAAPARDSALTLAFGENLLP